MYNIGEYGLVIAACVVLLLLFLAPTSVFLFLKYLGTWSTICTLRGCRKHLIANNDKGAKFMSTGTIILVIVLCLVAMWGNS